MEIQYDRRDGVATITLSNKKLNVLTPEMHRELYLRLQEFEADDTIKVGILTGEGETFSAGDDVKSPRKRLSGEALVRRHFFPRSEGDDIYPGWERDVMQMERLKPIVGAVRGWCLGQGFMYLLHLTDIRIASPDAKFGFPEIAYGMGGAGAMARILRHLPRTVAAQLVLTGDAMDAVEARSVALVNEVVPSEVVLDRAREVARRISSHPALAIRVEMEGLLRSADLDARSSYVLADHLYRLQRLGMSNSDQPIVDFSYKVSK